MCIYIKPHNRFSKHVMSYVSRGRGNMGSRQKLGMPLEVGIESMRKPGKKDYLLRSLGSRKCVGVATVMLCDHSPMGAFLTLCLADLLGV